jgi:putative spermidine/putrescine transport system ATP-binding protein
VFNNGRIEQLGTPSELYERPASRFVADFVGTSNLFDDRVSTELIGRGGVHSVRPEKMTVGAGESGAGIRNAAGTVVETIYLGSGIRLVVDLDAGVRVSVLEQNDRNRIHDEDRGDRVVVSWHDDDVITLGGADAAASAPAA